MEVGCWLPGIAGPGVVVGLNSSGNAAALEPPGHTIRCLMG